MNREQIAPSFYIEEHATLYALLHRQARTLCGEAGTQATAAGTKLYGQERGNRMAKRALRDGAELNMENYLKYGEWSDPKGESKNELIALSPTYTTHAVRCGWCEAWKKHDLLEYGKLYCESVDISLVHGFNPDNDLVIASTLSHGDPCCHFEWVGLGFDSPEALKTFGAQKAALEPKVLKDFLYHTGHLLSAMTRAYETALGVVKAQTIVQGALEEFQALFGEEKCQALRQEATLNFSLI